MILLKGGLIRTAHETVKSCRLFNIETKYNSICIIICYSNISFITIFFIKSPIFRTCGPRNSSPCHDKHYRLITNLSIYYQSLIDFINPVEKSSASDSNWNLTRSILCQSITISKIVDYHKPQYCGWFAFHDEEL